MEDGLLSVVPLSKTNNSVEQSLSWSFNAPNAVTIARIVLAIVIAWLLLQGGATEILLAGVLLIAGWVSDGLDGLLARRMGQSTLAGALFDLIADRVLMTPTLILAIAGGLWLRTAGLMPFNPYPYAITVVAADLTVMAGVFTYIWKRRRRAIPFPAPTLIARITYSIQMPTLVMGILGIGPDVLLAIFMYLTIIFTLVASYSYLKKGGYVFTC
jgi:phosphatidylglycerophosphate synthase